MFRNLTFKICQHLYALFRRLGAEIVYASANKIILNTKKNEFGTGESFVQYILKTIITYPLFSYLTLEPKKYWKILLFKDNHNYCGINESEQVIVLSYFVYKYF